MSISIISDIHIKQNGDDGDVILQKFFDSAYTKQADEVYFLGDIFDVLAGPHKEYITMYPTFFKGVEKLLSQGKKILYVEGNHDVHLDNLFKAHFTHYFEEGKIKTEQFSMDLIINNKRIYISHGDDLEEGNLSYKIWKWFLMTPVMRFITNYLLPFSFIDNLAKFASSKSRTIGSKKFDVDKNKMKFRLGAKKKLEEGYDYVIGGHSHIVEEIDLESGKYFNNGFPKRDRKFIFISNEAEVLLLDLN
jgi:UDP-2,3-diacylglucosamine hydrolase